MIVVQSGTIKFQKEHFNKRTIDMSLKRTVERVNVI